MKSLLNLCLIFLSTSCLWLMACDEERIRRVEISESSCATITSTLGCEDSTLYRITIAGSAKGNSLYIWAPSESPDSLFLDCGDWSKDGENHCIKESGQSNKCEFTYVAYMRCIPAGASFGSLEFDVRESVPSSWFGGSSDFENKVTLTCR
ncbi:hypothetical protein [Marinoscillum sp.]|uniref:hypothetical protein n=1 Tax=Marinoscillum sp. TaxID=2024838 RepID=UPI003BAC60FC